MAAPRQGLPVRLERAPHRGAAFALSNASKRARTRSIGARSRGSLFIFRSSPAVAPPGPPQPSLWPRGGLEIGATKRGEGRKFMAIVNRHGLPLSASAAVGVAVVAQ